MPSGQNVGLFDPCIFMLEFCRSWSGFLSSALLAIFLGEDSPPKIEYREKGTLALTSLLEDLDIHVQGSAAPYGVLR